MARSRHIFSGKKERHRLRQLDRCNHKNIQDAVEDAKSGYRIRILPGKYKEMPSRRVAVGSYGNPPCADDYVETEGFANEAPPPAGPRSNDPPVRPQPELPGQLPDLEEPDRGRRRSPDRA